MNNKINNKKTTIILCVWEWGFIFVFIFWESLSFLHFFFNFVIRTFDVITYYIRFCNGNWIPKAEWPLSVLLSLFVLLKQLFLVFYIYIFLYIFFIYFWINKQKNTKKTTSKLNLFILLLLFFVLQQNKTLYNKQTLY